MGQQELTPEVFLAPEQGSPAPEHPFVSSTKFGNIPQVVREYPSWIANQCSPDPQRPGKIKKQPLSVRTGKFAEWNKDPATFEEAVEFCATRPNHQLGFLLKGTPFG